MAIKKLDNEFLPLNTLSWKEATRALSAADEADIENYLILFNNVYQLMQMLPVINEIIDKVNTLNVDQHKT